MNAAFLPDGRIRLIIDQSHPGFAGLASRMLGLDVGAVALSQADEGDNDHEAGRWLAETFLTLFNCLERAGKAPDPEEAHHMLATVSDELAELGWVLEFKGGQWKAYPHGEGAVALSQARAPVGGIVIGGKRFAGGQWIPGTDLAKATPEQRQAIEAHGQQRKQDRLDRGPVNLALLHARLAPHSHHELNKQETANAKRTYAALLRHHDEATAHRLEEIANDLTEGYNLVPEEEEGVRRQLSRRIRAVQYMLDVHRQREQAKAKPEAAGTAAKPETKAAPPVQPVADRPQDAPAEQAERPAEGPQNDDSRADDLKVGAVIARTKPRERMDVDDGQRWHEYRLRKIDAAEFDKMRKAGAVGKFDHFREYVIESRHIETDGDKKEEGDWQFWNSGNTPEEAIAEGMGDTGYKEAESLHPTHAVHARHSQEVYEASKAVGDAEKASKAAYEAVLDHKYESNREFSKKIKDVTDEKKVEQIKQRMLKTRGPRMEELRKQAAEADKAHQEAKAKHEELKARKPQLEHYPDLAEEHKATQAAEQPKQPAGAGQAEPEAPQLPGVARQKLDAARGEKPDHLVVGRHGDDYHVHGEDATKVGIPEKFGRPDLEKHLKAAAKAGRKLHIEDLEDGTESESESASATPSWADTYERSATLSDEELADAHAKLAAMGKDELLAAAKAIDHVGVEKKSAPAIRKELGQRMEARRNSAKRAGVIDRKPVEQAPVHPLAGMGDSQKRAHLAKTIMAASRSMAAADEYMKPMQQAWQGVAEGSRNAVAQAVVDAVAEHKKFSSGDMPLTALYDAAKAAHPELTKEAFVGALSRLDDNDHIRLTGWAGSVDRLPDPDLVPMVGEKMMAWAHIPREAKPLPKGAKGETTNAAPSAPPPAAHPTDPKQFAAEVQAVADADEYGYGPKAFIHRAYEGMKQKYPGLTREEFDKQLLAANAAGHVRLERADYVEAMHPDDVKRSKVKHPVADASFHLIHAPGKQRQWRRDGDDAAEPAVPGGKAGGAAQTTPAGSAANKPPHQMTQAEYLAAKKPATPARTPHTADDVTAAVAAIKNRLRTDPKYGTADVKKELDRFKGMDEAALYDAVRRVGLSTEPTSPAHALAMLGNYAIAVQAAFERSDA